jgi:N-acetylglucosamine-6-sulfatase
MSAPDRGVPLALTALLALVVLAAVATAARAQGGPVRYRDPVFQQVRRTNDIVYGRATDIPTGQPVDLRLDLYQPQGDTAPARPVLVFVHGGGFVGGDKSNGQRWADEFARRGWVAVSIEYRLSQGNQATVGIPAAVSDARQALRWLRTVATTYRLDLDRVVVGGGSAGAITALFLTYTELEKGPADADVRVAGVMDLWGALYGQEKEMTAGEPPLIIVHGTEDTVVPYRNAEALRDRAAAVGIPYAFHPLAGVGHGANEMSAQISAWTAEFLYPLLWPDSGAATATMVPTLGPTTSTPRPPTATRRPPGTANPTATARPAPAGAPNIVFVLTDDLDLELGTMGYTPNIQRLLADAGTTLDDFYLTYPLCCPSRTTILRGQYLHNHGVVTNKPPVGGYEKFLAVGNEDSTVGTWLQSAGYRTVFVGKYLNGYPVAGDLRHIPAGWTEWYSPAAGNPYSSYRYTLNENGRLVVYGSAPEDHITDVIAGKAEAAIRRAGSDARPFFMYVAPYAPHAPADPAPRHATLFPDTKVPRVPSFNEADVSDKPARIQALDLLKPRAIATLDANYRKRLQSMQAVDEMVARLVTALDETGELANTYFVFTSDNGYHMGHHRLPAGKTTAYEEDIHVPFIVRGPGVPAGRTLRGYLAGNVDLAPTFAELAGAAPPEFVDGRSLVPLWRGESPDPASWRQTYLVEGYAGGGRTGTETPTPTVVVAGADAGAEAPALGLLEPPDAFDLAEEAAVGRPAQEEPGEDDGTEVYVALRTGRYTYVEWKQTGERELYDNEVDPYQLENLAARVPSTWIEVLSERANALHACVAAECRELEARPIELPVVTPGTPGPATATPKPATATRPPATRTATATPVLDRRTLYLPLVGRGWRPADLAPPRTSPAPLPRGHRHNRPGLPGRLRSGPATDADVAGVEQRGGADGRRGGVGAAVRGGNEVLQGACRIRRR